jgi:hypothetical protein
VAIVNTVAYHIKELFLRLDAHDRQQMIAKSLSMARSHGSALILVPAWLPKPHLSS